MARSRRQGRVSRPPAARRKRGRGGSAADFTKPLTGKRAGRIANAQAGMEFNPQIREMRNQARGSAAREADIGRWYKELASDYGASTDAALKAFEQAQAGVNAQLADSSARGQQTLKDLAASDASFAKLVGGPTNASGLSRIAEAAAASDRHRSTLAAPIATSSAAHIANLGSRRTSSRLRGVEATGAERDRREEIRSNIAALRREKGASKAARMNELRQGERDYKLSRSEMALAKREFSDPKPYDEAILAQAQMGLQGDVASANAQTGAASIYAGADRRTAKATERAARAAERGRQATARGQVQTAKSYGKGGGSSGGYNTREAQALLSSAGKAFKTPQAAVNYLVNRGVKLPVARKAVKAAVGGATGGGKRSGSRRARPGVGRGWGKSRVPKLR